MKYIEGELILFPDQGFGIYSGMKGRVLSVDWDSQLYSICFFKSENPQSFLNEERKTIDFLPSTLPDRSIPSIWRYKVGETVLFSEGEYAKYKTGVIRNLRVEAGFVLYNVTFKDPQYTKRHVLIGEWDMPICSCDSRVLLNHGCQCGGFQRQNP